jgi:hypothetical protein
MRSKKNKINSKKKNILKKTLFILYPKFQKKNLLFILTKLNINSF